MAWLAVDMSGDAYMFGLKPYRSKSGVWLESDPPNNWHMKVEYPYLSNMTLGNLTWDDEPVEI